MKNRNEMTNLTISKTSYSNLAEASVCNRYAAATQARAEALCCPVQYARDFLVVFPQETKRQDYHVTTDSIGSCCGTDGVCC